MGTVKELTRKMKDSGVEWIGEIPEDWEVVKLKNIARIMTGNTPSMSNEGYYSNSNGVPWIKPDNLLELDGVSDAKLKLTESGKVQGRIVPKDTMLICVIGSIGKFGYTIEDSAFNQQINAILFNSKVLKKYGLYYMSVQKEQQKYYGNGNVVQILNASNQGMIYFTLPLIEEQKAIANFLDKKTQEIDNIISKTKKAIEEYKKYKQSLITETVTKGLDKDVEMKDSGIEWIGEIPEHWDTIKFKDLFKFGSGLTITKSDLLDEGIKVINYGEIHSKYKFDLDINRDELKCVDKSYLENRKNALINKGDFVFCDTSEDREGSGNCIVLRENNDELIFAGSHTVTARLRRNENPIYIRYMIMASSIKEQISSTVVGIKVYSITQAILKTIIGVIPPLKEQEQIVSYLDKKTNQIDQIISTKEKLLIEMEAYKKSLIYETVTGKREVE